MKTDYAALGKRALERLRATCPLADEVQRDILFEILSKNRNTEFGRKYGFSQIKSIADFQKKVPLSGYDDYEGDILRIVRGGKNILTAEEPVYFCISSGTTGDEKFIPVTGGDVEMQYLYDYGLVFGAVREYYGGMDEREIFGKIFQVGEFGKTFMDDGRIKGIRSGCVYLCADQFVGFDASDYCVPKELLFPESLEDQLYLKLRFALAERGLTAIHGVFINRVAAVMDYLVQNWNMLLNDMERGTIDEAVELSEAQRRHFNETLPPNPERARELREIPLRKSLHGIIPKIWKNMKYILAIGGKSFPYFTEKVMEYAGEVPICHYAYAASECVFGVAEKMNIPDRYILFPEAVFFEFIPIKEPHKILTMSELKTGGKYEIIFTNRSGLYRYRLGDVVEVVGWFDRAPVVKYSYRINQVINIAGEKTNCEQLSMAVRRFSEITGADVMGYCVCEDYSGLIPRYLFYIECSDDSTIGNANSRFTGKAGGNATDNTDGNTASEAPGVTGSFAEVILEECMRNANFDYRSCESMNEIAPLKLAFLQAGSFRKYEKRLAGTGKPMGQNKLLHFLDTDEKKEFFARQILKKENGL